MKTRITFDETVLVVIITIFVSGIFFGVLSSPGIAPHQPVDFWAVTRPVQAAIVVGVFLVAAFALIGGQSRLRRPLPLLPAGQGQSGASEPVDVDGQTVVPSESGYYWVSGYGAAQVPMVVFVDAGDYDAGAIKIQLPNGARVPEDDAGWLGARWAGPIPEPDFAVHST